MKLPKMNKRAISRLNLVLLLAILVMVNLVSGNTFFRLDLTHNDAYSLSSVTRETLALLEDPMRIRVFYSAEIPAPYNGIRQYLLDLLREYDGAENDHFSYEVVDVSTPEGKLEAQGYGLQQVEIQEIQSDEFQSRAVYMGAVVIYGTVVERIDGIGSTDGLEYRITTAMNSAITQVDALSGTSGVTMRAYVSPAIGNLQISGFSELETELGDIYTRINADNFDRISYEFNQPASDTEIEAIATEYGLQPLGWESPTGARRGMLGIVLTYEDQVERIPLEVFSRLFGGYTLDDPANIEETIRQALRSLVATTEQVAYAQGTGEKDLNDNQQGAGPLAQLLSERYDVSAVDLNEENIPAGIDTLIVNGPTREFTEVALYRIDQFLMGGGSVLAFLDSYRQIIPTQQEMYAGAQPSWIPVDTGLEPVLEHYGLRLSDTIVLDEESYRTRPGGGRQSQQLYQAPILGGEGVSRESVVTRGLQDIIDLYSLEILPTDEVAGADTGNGADGADDSGDRATPVYTALLRTSPRSWTVTSPDEIGPWTSGVPADADAGRKDVAVLLEGSFTSWFDGPVDLGLPVQEASPEEAGDTVAEDTAVEGEVASAEPAVAADSSRESEATALEFERYRASSLEPGKIVVIGSSAFTTSQLLNPQARTPNGTFLMNALDYLNGMPGMAELRAKGLGVPKIEITSDASRVAARWTNTIVVPLIVVALGIIVWFRRKARARTIRSTFKKED